MKSMRILGTVALCLFGLAMADGCKSKTKDSPVAKPTAKPATPQAAQPPGYTWITQTDTLGECSDVSGWVCTCYDGGFTDDSGNIWDIACCFGTTLQYGTCGDSATCDTGTFQCYNL